MRRAFFAIPAAAAVVALACLFMQPGTALAQDSGPRVSMVGSMGGRQALLVIDGAPPSALTVGATTRGVKLVSVNGDEAVVQVSGRNLTLRVGAAPVSVGGGGSDGGGTRIVLSSGSNGHFTTEGAINGRASRFLVDTGASYVAMSEAEAERLGVPWKQGQRMGLSTANGTVVGHLVPLNSVRIGDVEVYNVQAVVQPAPMPYILLGNSYLTRFQMRRENDILTLDRRF